MVFRVEALLRASGSTVGLPYWNTQLDQGLPTPEDSIIWSDDFFGDGNGVVSSGPFANWSVSHGFPGMIDPMCENYLCRYVTEFGQLPGNETLIEPEDISTIMQLANYSELTYCENDFLENVILSVVEKIISVV